MSRHDGVSCDSCLKGNFRGRRYKCLVCYDYDLCETCYEASVTNSRHTADHPMQCILTRADFDLFFGGESVTNTDQPQSYTCPYCSRMGFTDVTLQEHVNAEHTDTTFEVVCPLCAAMPGGDPNLMTDDFAGHLSLEHRSSGGGGSTGHSTTNTTSGGGLGGAGGPRDLISFMDDSVSVRHNVRRIPHSSHLSGGGGGGGGRGAGSGGGGGQTTSRPRRSMLHFSVFDSSGLNALSPSSSRGGGGGGGGGEPVDPIAELLSQLSGVRRSTSNNSGGGTSTASTGTSTSTTNQLQQLQMQLQLERQQVNAARQQLERLPRRQNHNNSTTATATATSTGSGHTSSSNTSSSVAARDCITINPGATAANSTGYTLLPLSHNHHQHQNNNNNPSSSSTAAARTQLAATTTTAEGSAFLLDGLLEAELAGRQMDGDSRGESELRRVFTEQLFLATMYNVKGVVDNVTAVATTDSLEATTTTTTTTTAATVIGGSSSVASCDSANTSGSNHANTSRPSNSGNGNGDSTSSNNGNTFNSSHMDDPTTGSSNTVNSSSGSSNIANSSGSSSNNGSNSSRNSSVSGGRVLRGRARSDGQNALRRADANRAAISTTTTTKR